MAARNARNSRTDRRYRARGTMDGNLARKPERRRETDSRELERRLERSGRMDFDQLYERSPETAAERNARRRAQFKASVRPAQKVSFLALLGFVCVLLLMVSLLLCYVRLNDISRSIVSMKSEIKQLEVEQVSLLTQHEKVFDLSAVKEAAEAGFTNLKGHRNVGGMRASIYNAMPVEGVERLADFIREFDKRN